MSNIILFAVTLSILIFIAKRMKRESNPYTKDVVNQLHKNRLHKKCKKI